MKMKNGPSQTPNEVPVEFPINSPSEVPVQLPIVKPVPGKSWFLKRIKNSFVHFLSRTRVFLSSPKCLVSLTPKPIKSVSNDESEPLKSAYLTSDELTCENFKHSN